MDILKTISNLFKRDNKKLNFNISGIWEGYYKCTSPTHEYFQDKERLFKLHLAEEEDVLHGHFLEKSIDGKAEDQINFYGQLQGRRVELNKISQYVSILKSANTVCLIEPQTPVYIKYYGVYYEQKSKFIGDWSLSFKYEDLKYSQNGYWEMEKLPLLLPEKL